MSLASRLFKPRPTIILGRWATKTVAQQLDADVNDPGYDQMHWSACPPGQARQAAIRHYQVIEGNLRGHRVSANK